ncbi:MAG: hypothetical protein HYY25_01170 [Candidatus Wallbacteria bacterium]|nr:hypothetical protein [Candidatus Wallbacteria bacterium]
MSYKKRTPRKVARPVAGAPSRPEGPGSTKRARRASGTCGKKHTLAAEHHQEADKLVQEQQTVVLRPFDEAARFIDEWLKSWAANTLDDERLAREVLKLSPQAQQAVLLLLPALVLTAGATQLLATPLRTSISERLN